MSAITIYGNQYMQIDAWMRDQPTGNRETGVTPVAGSKAGFSAD